MGETGKAGSVTDSKGRPHYVIYQTYGTTCGPASMAMLEHYHKNIQVCTKESAEERVRKISEWQEGAGTSFGSMLDTLDKKLGIPCNLIQADPKNAFATLKAYVTPRTPAIVRLEHSWQAMGHIALCRSIDSDGIGVFLDPACGLVESKKGNLPLFRFVETGKLLLSGQFIVSFMKK